jgi:hypothetical protein
MLAKVLSRYVFIPTQKFNDVSVLQYSAITYPELLRNVTEFCRSRNVPLVVKIHPHLSGKPRESQEACARGTKHQRHSTKAHEASSPPPPVDTMRLHHSYSVVIADGDAAACWQLSASCSYAIE